MGLYKAIVKPIFFSFDPEKIHHLVFSGIKTLSKIPGVSGLNKSMFRVNDTRLEREVFGLKFSNPVGLAAGFDKDALLFNELSSFGLDLLK